jgi:hypothetical protein
MRRVVPSTKKLTLRSSGQPTAYRGLPLNSNVSCSKPMQFSSVSSRRTVRPHRLFRCGKARASLVGALGVLETVRSRNSVSPWCTTVGASSPRLRVLQSPSVQAGTVQAHAGSAPAPSGLPVLRRSARRLCVSVRSEMKFKPCAVSA